MEIAILGLLILMNGFFALSEIALVSSKRTRLEQSKLEGSKGAKIALRLLDNSENFLSAIQIGITLIGIVTGVYGGMNIAGDIEPFFQKISFTSTYAHEIALSVTVLIITYISIVIGELVPKTVALSNPEKVAAFIAPVIYFFSSFFYPFVALLAFSTNIAKKVIGIKKQAEQLTETELRQMIKLASKEGVIEKEQNILHEKVFYFSDKKAKHLMTHRTDVEWIDIEKTDDEVRASLLTIQHSKVVCCKGTLDHVAGILYLKDYFKSAAMNDQVDIDGLLVKPVIVTENTNAQKVLSLLRKKKRHICCVFNEYGGFEGIITLYNIFENLIGQMPDEDDIYEPDVFVRNDKSVLVNGDAPIETLTEIIENFKIDFEKIEYSTVAGFVIYQLERIPKLGDRLNYLGYEIQVVDIDGNKVDKILISKAE